MMETDFDAVFAELVDETSTRQCVGDRARDDVRSDGPHEYIELTVGFFAELFGNPMFAYGPTDSTNPLCAKVEYDQLSALLIGPTEDVVQPNPKIVPSAPTPPSASPALRNYDTMNKRARNLSRQDLSARMSKYYHHGLWREWEAMMKSCIGDAEFDERKALSFLVG
jgi:hypothetical protein